MNVNLDKVNEVSGVVALASFFIGVIASGDSGRFFRLLFWISLFVYFLSWYFKG